MAARSLPSDPTFPPSPASKPHRPCPRSLRPLCQAGLVPIRLTEAPWRRPTIALLREVTRTHPAIWVSKTPTVSASPSKECSEPTCNFRQDCLNRQQQQWPESTIRCLRRTVHRGAGSYFSPAARVRFPSQQKSRPLSIARTATPWQSSFSWTLLAGCRLKTWAGDPRQSFRPRKSILSPRQMHSAAQIRQVFDQVEASP